MSTSIDPQATLALINDKLLDEKALYEELETLYAAGVATDATDASYASIIGAINTLEDDIRVLFSSINDYYDAAASSHTTTAALYANKFQELRAMEDDLLDRKKLQNINNAASVNKMRMVEINTYYSSAYNAQTEIMKVIIFVCALILIITLLTKSSILSASIADVLMAIIIIIGTCIVTYKLYDLSIRNNMNFEHYEWGKNPSSLPAVSESFTARKHNVVVPFNSTQDYVYAKI